MNAFNTAFHSLKAEYQRITRELRAVEERRLMLFSEDANEAYETACDEAFRLENRLASLAHQIASHVCL